MATVLVTSSSSSDSMSPSVTFTFQDMVKFFTNSAANTPYHLSAADSPNISLVSVPLTTSNYLSWKRNVLFALDTRAKLAFVDGSLPSPTADSPHFDSWCLVDKYVHSWLLNSLSRELVDNFNSSSTARDLWLALEAQFGQLNLSLIYQIQRALFTTTQGDLTVSSYYAKLKTLWADLDSLVPSDDSKLVSITKLVQFLHGLHDRYAHARSQLLLMQPIPSVDATYSLFCSVESQSPLPSPAVIAGESALAVARPSPIRKDPNGRFCTFCKRSGHLRDSCFKLTGEVPGWYIQNYGQSGSSAGSVSTQSAHLVNTPLDHLTSESTTHFAPSSTSGSGSNPLLLLQQALSQLLQTSSLPSAAVPGSLLSNTATAASTTSATSVGLSSNNQALFASFREFSGSVSLLQGQDSNTLLGVGRLKHGLYIFNKRSFLPHVLSFFLAALQGHCSQTQADFLLQSGDVYLNNLALYSNIDHPMLIACFGIVV